MAKITGIDTPFGGVSFETSESEKVKAKRLITFLEDRRGLYRPWDVEMPKHCVDSIIEIRHFLTTEISSTKDGDYAEALRDMRAAGRRFLDLSKPMGHVLHGDRSYFYEAWQFFNEPGTLRA